MKPYEVVVVEPALPLISLRAAVLRDARYGLGVGEEVGLFVLTGGSIGAIVTVAFASFVSALNMGELESASTSVEFISSSVSNAVEFVSASKIEELVPGC